MRDLIGYNLRMFNNFSLQVLRDLKSEDQMGRRGRAAAPSELSCVRGRLGKTLGLSYHDPALLSTNNSGQHQVSPV
jgi:hypothetical protein